MADRIDQTKVWDIFIRLFHWSFALAVVLAWLSHEWRGTGRTWHEWFGYAALGLAALRIIWGFVGSKYARFSQFLHWPVQYFRYLHNVFTGKEARYLGHNPLGGLMIIALIVVVIATGITGYYLTDRTSILFGLGHRAQEEVHEILGNLFVILVPLHILGVIWESLRHKENLTWSMVTGWKKNK